MKPKSQLYSAWLITIVLLSCFPETGRSDCVIGPDEGRFRLRWQDAGEAIGETAFVCGQVRSVKGTKDNTFLIFDGARSSAFVVVVRQNNLKKFSAPLDTLYRDKIICVRGTVTTHQDHPEIIVTGPHQIEIVDRVPARRSHAPSSKRNSSGVLTVATYNVLNLFDSEDDIYHADESTSPKPRIELESLSRTIHALDADVLALQEVENRGYLKRFRDVFLSDMGYQEIVHFEGNDARGIDVCVLSRVPIGAVRSHRHLRFFDQEKKPRRFERDLLAVTIEPPGSAPFEIWIVHLKSNYGGREHAEPIRFAEAQAIRGLLDRAFAHNPEARILVMGDFNDLWNSKALKTIVGTGKTALSCPLQDIPPDTITFNKQPYRSMIDFILFSPAIFQKYVSDSYQVLPGTVASSGSDHNPVKVQCRTK